MGFSSSKKSKRVRESKKAFQHEMRTPHSNMESKRAKLEDMQGLWFDGTGCTLVQNLPIPSLSSGEALIEIELAGSLSGILHIVRTDIDAYT